MTLIHLTRYTHIHFTTNITHMNFSTLYSDYGYHTYILQIHSHSSRHGQRSYFHTDEGSDPTHMTRHG
jgi:hypothetical protein